MGPSLNDRRGADLRPQTTSGGDVRSEILFDGGGARGLLMYFSPMARTRWHRHAGGQFLYTVGGSGLIKERGHPAVLIRPGDVYWCEPGVEHWHGAHEATHLVQLALHIGDVHWAEEIDAAEYSLAFSDAKGLSRLPNVDGLQYEAPHPSAGGDTQSDVPYTNEHQ